MTTADLQQLTLNPLENAERILLSAPHVGPRERELMIEAFDSGWIAPAGPHLDRFEEMVAEITGRQFAVAVSSGTAALHLALLEAGVGRDDLVLSSTLTFVGSVVAAHHMGVELCFIDSEATSWNMDPALLREELQARAKSGRLPKAVITVDLFGHTADYDQIVEICSEYNVPLIVDAAESLGARHNNGRAGQLGQSAIVSFNGNKIATTSGGGAFLTDDPDVAQRARYLSTQARSNAAHYEHVEVGFNYRLSNICAAIGIGQLEWLDERIARRGRFHTAYTKIASQLDGFSVLQPPPWSASNHWLSCATVDPEVARIDRDSLIAALNRANVEARPVWKPLHLQPVFKSCSTSSTTTVSETVFETGICLPSGSSMSDADLLRVITVIEEELR